MSKEKNKDCPKNNADDAAVIRNLEDAGCSAEMVKQFMEMHEKGCEEEQLGLLSQHRRQLLDRVHRDEKRIDCLDYLVHQITHKKQK